VASSIGIEELEFVVQETFPVQTESIRHRVQFAGEANIALGYAVPSATYRTGEQELTVETEYTATVSGSSEDDDVDIAFFRHRVLVALKADRAVTDEDAMQGRLDPGVHLANLSAHAYHRLALLAMSAHLGLPPIILPVSFEMISDDIEPETADAGPNATSSMA
jgi:hypothetical protein